VCSLGNIFSTGARIVILKISIANKSMKLSLYTLADHVKLIILIIYFGPFAVVSSTMLDYAHYADVYVLRYFVFWSQFRCRVCFGTESVLPNQALYLANLM
jgi:hypothetical protein